MSSDKAPEKLYYVKDKDNGQEHTCIMLQDYLEVLATYIREDLTLDAKLKEPGVITVQEFEQQRRREMFEKYCLSNLANSSTSPIQDWDWKYVNENVELLILKADKFARGEG